MNMSDLKFYGKVVLAVAAAGFVLSRVVPGIGMRVGFRPDPLPFIPSIPFINPVMVVPQAQASAVSWDGYEARNSMQAGMA